MQCMWAHGTVGQGWSIRTPSGSNRNARGGPVKINRLKVLEYRPEPGFGEMSAEVGKSVGETTCQPWRFQNMIILLNFNLIISENFADCHSQAPQFESHF